MDQLGAHQRAQEVFAEVLAAVSPAELGAPSPCAGWDVQAVIDHVVDGNQRVQLRAGREPSALPDDLVAAHAASAAAAHAVFAAPDGLTRSFELPFGSFPGAGFIGFRTIDLYVHAWDVAKATGRSTDLDPELAAFCLDAAKQRMGPGFRGEGRPFGEERPCPEGRNATDQLMAFLGRDVD